MQQLPQYIISKDDTDDYLIGEIVAFSGQKENDIPIVKRAYGTLKNNDAIGVIAAFKEPGENGKFLSTRQKGKVIACVMLLKDRDKYVFEMETLENRESKRETSC